MVGNVQVLVEHGYLGSLRDGLSLWRYRLEPWNKLSAIKLCDLRQEKPHCFLIILEVTHWVGTVLGSLEN